MVPNFKARPIAYCVLFAAAWCFQVHSLHAQCSPDLDFLLNGVKAIDCNGIPGPLGVYGPDAFPVVLGNVSSGIQAPIVAASRLGSGRIIAFGHDSFPGAVDKADNKVLLQNAVHWCSGNTSQPAGQIKVGLVKQDALLKQLQAAGFATVKLDAKTWHQNLNGLNVVCVDVREWDSPASRVALDRFLRAGGGLVTASLGWGWLQLHNGKTLNQDHAGNQFLSQAGILWLDGTFGHPKTGYTVDKTPDPLTQASKALDAILNPGNITRKKADDMLSQATWTITQISQTLPATDRLLQPRLQALRRQASQSNYPTAKKPLKASDAAARLILTMEIQQAERAKPKDVKACPAANAFPGPVPTDAPRVKDSLSIDTKVPEWHSTGLYAPPGEVIRVTIPADATKANLEVRIGCHKDVLWDKPSWSRAPDISTSRPLRRATTEIASAFGGLIYIDVNNTRYSQPLAVTIEGAVRAPHYVLGKTSLSDWQQTIRNPAPWAELETAKVIFSVPSSAVRALDNPEALMQYWDRVLDGIADLATIPRARKRPERIVADVQISAGYMHSGYPIMTHLDVVKSSLDVQGLTTKGSWGHYHELGHNHQARDWTFDGTTEVTCNLFSLYVFDQVLKLGLQGHPAVSAASREKAMHKYFSHGAQFSDWKSEPFTALIMYYQLAQAFGWEPYKKVFAEYRGLTKDQHPKTDDEKHDQWMVRFSRAVGKNLGPFFQAWGIPTSAAARDSLKDLPAWLPEPDFPAKYKTQ